MFLYIQSKVSHEMAAELAHAVVTELEEGLGKDVYTALQSGNIMGEMSRGFATGHAATVTRAVFAKQPTLHAQLPVTDIDVGLEDRHPAILLSDYIQTMATAGKLSNLTGKACLQDFWKKWMLLRPKHPVCDLSEEDLSRTIPICLFADEGRGLKKSAVMVLGSEPVLGDGCDAEDAATACESTKLNFRGNTFRTRQLYTVMHKRMYSKNEMPLRLLADAWARDLRKCFVDGLRIFDEASGAMRTWRVVVLGLKGDWPALAKLGSIHRTFRREAYPSGDGICHLCMANTASCPNWHDHNLSTAAWTKTIATASEPWRPGLESSFTTIIPMEPDMKPRFFLVDIFHTCHKGVQADLCGSAIEARII